jgi:channel protein (hemolysin III family)
MEMVAGLPLIARADILSLPGFREPVSSLTHLVGAGVFAVLGFFLIRRGLGSPRRVVSLAVYVFATVFLLSMSGVYHMLEFGGTARAVLARLDHGAIFVLIAGTFTPAHGILFRGPGRWGMLLLVWLAAFAGITLKTIFFSDMSEWLGLLLYLLLGWLGALSGVALWQRYGAALIKPLFWGGVAYTAGALVDFLGWPVLVPGVFGTHEAFHIAVLVGAALHWKFIWQFAAGTPQPSPPPSWTHCSRLDRDQTLSKANQKQGQDGKNN